MIKYVLKDFQQKAQVRFNCIVNDLEYLDCLKVLKANPTDPKAQKEANHGRHDPFHIQIDAPTGSGKTVLIGHLVKDGFADYVHILFSPGAGNLEEQTAKKLSSIIGPESVELVNETTFSTDAVAGVTYVGNWEQFVSRDTKTGKYKNRVVREGDTKSMFHWLDDIGSKYIPVVVTIDEAHHGSSSQVNSIKRFLADIQQTLGYSPLFIEASATHILDDVRKVKIELADVIKEGLIRKNARLNGNDLIKKVDALTSEQRASYMIEPFLLEHALEKQKELDAEYIKVDAHEVIDGKKVFYHSLIGLQIPNGAAGNAVIDRVEAQLRDKHGITRDNGMLAVFLSDDKTSNMENIESPASPVRVLIYKQGVATGWDCPRAQILLGFRHITSKIFTKQNLGRFLRTTQAKHYGNDVLDHTYIVSNVGDLGQLNFGDEIDKDFQYEKEAIFRVSEDSHVALSSFNNIAIAQQHYGYANQSVVKLPVLNSAWINVAAKTFLWNSLSYAEVDRKRESTISSEADTESMLTLESSAFTIDKISQEWGSDTAKQLADFRDKIYEAILDSDRDYGNNTQVARMLSQVIIRWYKEAVVKEISADKAHYGKLANVVSMVEAEKKSGVRNSDANWTEIAVEQLSLDSKHWKAVKAVILSALSAVPSIRVASAEEFETKGVKWAERVLMEDAAFAVASNETCWIAPADENKVKHFPEYYATCMITTKDSYHAGNGKHSSPEERFENIAIASLIKSSEEEGNKLAYFWKSPENKQGSLRLAVVTKAVEDNESKVSNFYPDYLLEMVKDGNYSPAVIEVKAEKDVDAANKDTTSILNAKAAKLVEIAGTYGIKAGLAFEKNAEWVVITEVKDNGEFVTQNFKEYMLEA